MGSNRSIHRAKTHLFLILFLLLLANPLASQELPVVAILPFESIAVSRADTDAVNKFLESSFTATKVYTVITAEQRDQALGDADAATCRNEECAAQVGKKLSAEQVVLGNVALSEGKYIINARIIETASARTLAADSISADGAEQLAQACDILSVGMIRRAVPGSLVEKIEEPDAGEAGSEGLETTVEQPVEPAVGSTGIGEGMEEGPPQPVQLSRADLWPLVNICGGMFMLELGNLMGSMSYELRRKISDNYVDYIEASWNFDELWKSYNSAYVGYITTTSLSYLSWSAAVASIPTYLFVFPDRAFRLSRLGAIAFTAGAGLSIAGNALDLLAGAQRYLNDFRYQDYMSAGTDFDELYKIYKTGHIIYSVERLSSYALWLIGGAGMISAFFLPGPQEEQISGFWDRASLIAGIAMVGLGSVTRTVALNARQADIESGGDEEAYKRYCLNSVLSYSLWAAGGVGMVLPFITDLGRDRTDARLTPVRPEQLRLKQLQLIPLPRGMVLRLTY